ncbi:MAG: helix-turn-helix domain-containing protein [Bacteroidales bacterium]|nr:helix-turn-helix domain-containing protein [Bacteroidales bacterium]
MNNLNIHIRLKEARKYLEFNQLKIATSLGIKQKTVSEIENGKIMNIPNEYIYFFYKNGISLEWLYTGNGKMLQEDTINSDKVYTDRLFLDKAENNQNKHENTKNSVKNFAENEDNVSTHVHLLLNAKDENIQSLINYIRSQEKMIAFLQEIIRKELSL